MVIDLERAVWIIGSGAIIVLLAWAMWHLVVFIARKIMSIFWRIAIKPISSRERVNKMEHWESSAGVGCAKGATIDTATGYIEIAGRPVIIDTVLAEDIPKQLEALIARLESASASPSRKADVPIKGRIAFDIPDHMRQGQTTTAVVRITRQMSLELRQLAAGLAPETTNVQAVGVADKMRVTLRSEPEGDFAITSSSSPEQVIAASGYTTWRFRVRPERRGRRKLILCATMLLPDALDLEPWEHEIEVAVLPGYGVWRLARTYPGAALSALALPFAGLLFEVSGAKDATQDLVEPRVRAFIGLPPKEEAAPATKPKHEAAPTDEESGRAGY